MRAAENLGRFSAPDLRNLTHNAARSILETVSFRSDLPPDCEEPMTEAELEYRYLAWKGYDERLADILLWSWAGPDSAGPRLAPSQSETSP